MTTRTTRARGITLDAVLRPLDGICGKCGGAMVIYPAGSVCLAGCSPLFLQVLFGRALDKERVAAGLAPVAEVVTA